MAILKSVRGCQNRTSSGKKIIASYRESKEIIGLLHAKYIFLIFHPMLVNDK